MGLVSAMSSLLLRLFVLMCKKLEPILVDCESVYLITTHAVVTHTPTVLKGCDKLPNSWNLSGIMLSKVGQKSYRIPQ